MHLAHLGGTGGGFANNEAELVEIGTNAFLSCPKVFLNGSIAQGAVIGEGNNRIK